MLKKIIQIKVFFIISIFILPLISSAATALTDDFAGTTIDAGKWVEYDTAGVGGTVGNVQQNGVLSITGDSTWNHNGLKSVQTFDRSKGDITVEGDWQLKDSCASDYSAPSVGVIYGDWINGSQESGSLSLIYYGGSFRLFNTSATFALDTQVSCVINTTIHYKFVVKQAGGVDVYLNGSLSPNGSLSAADAPNTYTNKPISLQQKSDVTNLTITVDNIVVLTSDTPSAPTNLIATPASGQVILNWTAPNSAGSLLTDYKIEYKFTSEPTVWTMYSHTASEATSMIVDGLLNGTSYDFRVSGINGVGIGISSGSISSIPNLSVSSTPSNLVANFGPNNHIGISWVAPMTDGGSSITDYLVEYKLSTEPTIWTTFVDGVSTDTSATVTGLTSGLDYNFRVSAINLVGTGSPSNIATKKAGAYLLYDDFTGTTIDINKWTEHDSAVSGSGGSAGNVKQNGLLSLVGSYTWNNNALKSVQNFDRSIGDIIIETDWTINSCGISGNLGAISYGNWITNGTLVTDTLFFQFADGVFKLLHYGGAGNVISGVSCTNGVPTHIKIVIKQVGGMDLYLNNSDTVTISLNAGQSPNTWNNQPVALQQYNTANSFFDNLTVSNTGYTIPSKITGLTTTPHDSQMELSWTAPANGGSAITDYLVQYKLSSEPTIWTTFAHTASVATNNFVTGLTNGLSYDFKVSAININGTGIASDIATTTPVQSTPSAPQNLLAGNTVSNQIDLTWSAPVSDGGANITDYLVEYKLTSEPTVWTTFAHGVSTTTSISVTSLTNGSSYDFRVSAKNSNGTGARSSTVTKPSVNSTPLVPVATSVGITGQPHVSEYLLGSYVYFDSNADPEGATTFRWLSSSSLGGTYSPIISATSINYTVDSSDLNKYIKLEVTPVSTVTPFTGIPVLSNAIGPITAANYLYHILSTGQSLSLGYAGSPVLSTTQPYSNKMLSGTDSNPGTNLIPLVEVSNESPAAAMGNGITFQNGVATVVTRHGVGGTAYSGLKKGTAPYTNGMQQMVNVRNAATLLGETSQVMGITTVHGETDSTSGTSAVAYEADLVEWQHDYETDIKAINGQVGTIPLFMDQMDSYTTYGHTTSVIPQGQLAASEDYPGKVILVGPKYFLNYSGTGPHLTNTSYRLLGEYYAKVMKKVFFDKVSWRPLSPDTIQILGNEIYAKFHVPAGVLAFDTTLVSQNTNYGFEYYDTTSSATISSVSIMNSDTVKITLSNAPSGGNQRLRYAYTGVANAAAGAQSAGAPRGNLRDTDPTVSLSGNNLYDWAVHFDKPIVTVTDTTSPTVTSLSIPSTSSSLTVPINSFVATDDYLVTGYLLTESSSAPLASDGGWSGTAPTSYTFSSQGSKTLYAWAKDAAGNVSTSMNGSVAVDTSAPTITAFTIPSTASSLTVSISSFTATDTVGVTGYLLTESSSAPLASDGGWSGTAPTSYMFGTEGSKTLYAWAKDAMGNVSSSLSASTNITLLADSYSFGGPSSGSAQIESSNFTVVPNRPYTGTITVTPTGSASTGLSAIVLTFSNSATAQTFKVTPTVTGTLTLVPTNSASLTNPSSLDYMVGDAPDLTAPTVTAFTIPSTASSLTVSISSFTATDTVGVTGYLLTESSSDPLASDGGWSGTAPTSYTFSSQGSKTLYAWAKDAAGNVSSSVSGSVSIDSVPTITNIISTPSSSGVSISWITDELSSSLVEYGLTSNYGTSTPETNTSPRVLNHSVSIANLVSCTTYHYKVSSIDESTKQAISNDNLFTTLGCTGGSAVNNQNSLEITSLSGGSIDLINSGNGITLIIPSSFSTQNADFQVKQLNKSETLGTTSVPSGYLTIGSYVYDLKALSDNSTTITSFDSPLTVSLLYTSSDITGMDDSSLKIYRWDGTNWNELTNCNVDTTLKKVTCDTSHFSVFGLFGKTRIVASSSSGGGGGSYIVYGCKDPLSLNYQLSLVVNNPSLCKYAAIKNNVTYGCKDTNALNYDKSAVNNDLSLCKYLTDVNINKYNFTRDLKLGMEGSDVKLLQEYLNNNGFIIAKNGAGSKGQEMEKFGPATKAALIRFQKAKGIKPANGYFGVKTRGFLTLNNLNKEETVSKVINKYNFTRDLKLGMEGSDVKLLQEYLNNNGFIIAKNGAGSKGQEMEKFGPATKAALIRFQKAKGIKPASGIFGPVTRLEVNK